MFRSTFIYLSKAAWARRMVTSWDFAWNAASRFVAGERLEDAIRIVQQLNQKGINATLDHLGEHITTPEEAHKAVEAINAIADAIESSGVKANISIKLTQIGMNLGEELCLEHLEWVLGYAKQRGVFVRLDMEDSPWVETTLKLYRLMRDERGFDNCGVVIQSYLYRSETDVRLLAQEGGRVRLCKGAYREPAEIAFPKKSDVDANYDLLVKLMVDGAMTHGSIGVSPDGRFPPQLAVASHDPLRLVHAKAYANQVGLRPPVGRTTSQSLVLSIKLLPSIECLEDRTNR
jgi:proline dehydrogenase